MLPKLLEKGDRGGSDPKGDCDIIRVIDI